MRGLALGLVIASLVAPAAARAQSLRVDGAAAGDEAGTAVAGAGDVNGDGRADLIVGAPFANGQTGAAYVLLGPFSPGTLDLAAPGLHGFVITGFARGSLTGWSVAGAGDVNGDGLGDMIVGAPSGSPGDEGPAARAGRAYVVFGSRTPAAVDLAHLGSAGFAVIGQRARFPDGLGWSVAGAGDVNGDGRDDVIAAAPGNPGFEDEMTEGAAYVVFGRRGPATLYAGRLGGAGFAIHGGSTGGLGSVAGAGDFDGDGYDDVIAGDGGAAGHGIATIVFGGRSHAALTLRRPGRRGIVLRGATGSQAGTAVAGAGDVNGDGRPDVVVGAPQGNRSSPLAAGGGAWVLYGARTRRAVDLRHPGTRGFEIVGGGQDWAGSAIAGAGRVNADRLDDFVLTSRGSLAVVFGRRARRDLPLDSLAAPAGWTIDGRVEPNQFLTAGNAGGFTTTGALGDGSVLAGARLADHDARANSGSAYVFFAP